MHFTVPLNCFTWAVYRTSRFLTYPQIRSIASKSLSVVHWALQMLPLTMATEHAHHRKSWSQPPFPQVLFIPRAGLSAHWLPQGMVSTRSPHVHWPGKAGPVQGRWQFQQVKNMLFTCWGSCLPSFLPSHRNILYKEISRRSHTAVA